MDTIGSIPTPHLTDREILLLAYQQLQNVSDEFKSYKSSNDVVLHDLQSRLTQMERHMSTAEAVKVENEKRTKKQVTVIGFVITGINLIVSVLVQFLYSKK